ncbi:MAG TPA: GMC family oxidoreductase N-terminal domain-containing protein [Stellaceae bacterium]|nr:GMC family oxidoreductase N-terminal domain-containing protein [Stellaceae bacterium]
MTDGIEADYVIVGAGSAGCVLANRLSEDPSTRVLLIEAGGRDWNPYIHVPAGFMKMLDHPKLTWGFYAEPDEGTAGRAILYPRGRVLGGSSAINGLIYVRGQPEDFDHWAQLGNRGWGWDDVLPYFKKAENWQGAANEWRGTGGPLSTAHMTDIPPLCRAAIEAGKEIGLDYRDDVNALPRRIEDAPSDGRAPARAELGGIGYCQQTRGGRWRASTARTYLRPALRRPNLRVITKALVHRIVFDGRRAVAVEYERQGRVLRAAAAGEVILSAGAIGSPHILQLSGVGAPEHLSGIGIPVHHALAGVGQNLQDHYVARVSYAVAGAPTINERSHGPALFAEIARYLLTGKGMLTYSASLAAASVKVLPESATPDVQCVFAPGSFKDGQIGALDDFPGMTAGVWQMRPLSRGTVLAKSPDPHMAPAINPRYFSDPTDRRAVVAGLRFLRRFFAAPALARHVRSEILPGKEIDSDEALFDYAKRKGSTVYHASCTCRMGNGALAVVDDQLRVHGLDALRVVDASVMPTVTSTNTNAPTIMIAEKAAALIRAAARHGATAAAA